MNIILAVLGFLVIVLLTLSIPHAFELLAQKLATAAKEKTGISTDAQGLFGIHPDKLFRIVLIVAIIVAIIVWLITNSIIVGLIFFVVTFFLPKVIQNYNKSIRLIEFDERLPAALDLMSSSAKAGMSLAQTIEEVGMNSPKPINEEFMAMYQEHKLGTDLSQTIINARKRIGSRPFTLVASALLVNIEKGGNLPDALETLSNSLKEIWRLEQKLITSSAEGRKAMWVISAVPIFIALLVFALQPELASALTGSILGFAILFAAILTYVLGLYWLRNILNQEI
ncbi:MAG: type II secretion system F family protein [Gammaproteobacteria bacterium]|nr:type II secretion system F family protein [Gammaproteobacteria bacterium]